MNVNFMYFISPLSKSRPEAKKAHHSFVIASISLEIEIQKPEFVELTLIQSYKELFLSIPETGRKFRRGR
jgi:hypothetical protein